MKPEVFYSRRKCIERSGSDSGPFSLVHTEEEMQMNRNAEHKGRIRSLIEQSLSDRLPDGVSSLHSVSGVDPLIESLSDEVLSMISSKIQIRTCPKCGTVFASVNPRQWFCCHDCAKVYGKSSFKSKLESDQALSVYNKAYKAMAARNARGKLTKEDLDSWRVEAKATLEILRAGEISFEEFHRRITNGIRRWEHFEDSCI